MYTGRVKNITLSADEELITQAREFMRSQNRTLNDAFREWLASLSAQRRLQDFDEFTSKMRHIKLGGPYTRDEMNERR
jgi:hypothetical protein